ncbi:MAG: helix-turn-helix domain-containing protein [Bacteroidetes bacterium]|nr:helix-turn-helix domain-containing protein [Bacteroidota bacterium]
MAVVVIETETLEKLFAKIDNLERMISSFAQSGQLPGGENEWEYYTLKEALELLGIQRRSWYKTYRNTNPKVIPYAQYGDKVWIKKTDLKKFLEKRRLS